MNYYKQHKKKLSQRTGSLGPKNSALWPKINKTTGKIYSMGAAPLIYNTTTGIYNTAYDANAAKSSPSFKNFFGSKRKRKSRKKSNRRSRRRSTRRMRRNTRRSNRRRRKISKKGRRRWKSPSTRSRRMMINKCGKGCFLRPNNLGFPVCNPNCTLNEYGLEAAYKRARQYGYEDIARKAQRLRKKFK